MIRNVDRLLARMELFDPFARDFKPGRNALRHQRARMLARWNRDPQAFERASRIVEASRILDERRIAARPHVVENRADRRADLARGIPAAGVERLERGTIAGINKYHAHGVRAPTRKLCLARGGVLPPRLSAKVVRLEPSGEDRESSFARLSAWPARDAGASQLYGHISRAKETTTRRSFTRNTRAMILIDLLPDDFERAAALPALSAPARRNS
jgi:hypothetical protein